MPTYDWRCNKCQAKIEVVTRVDNRDTQPTPCVHCGARDWARIPVAPAVQRGEGWGSKGNW